jgi:hypothetical protein
VCFTGAMKDFDKLWNRTHDHEAWPSKSWIKVKNKKHPAMLRVKEAFELETQRGHARAR